MTNKIDKIQMPDGQVLELGGGGSGLEVCDIGMALYVDETKGLRRYLNGQIVDINTNTQAFLDRLLQIQTTNPDYFTTEDNWQAESLLNIDGCVYKFVLNYSGETVVSVRLPKYPDYVEINAGGTLPVVGNGMTLGWTDGTVNLGSATGSNGNYHFQFMQGSYGVSVGRAPGTGAPSGAKIVGITSNPTKSGIQTTLKQTKLKLRYFIQIATGSETENNITNEIELNNPSFFGDSKYVPTAVNNLSWLKSEGQSNPKGTYPSFYDWILENVNNGVDGFIGQIIYAWGSVNGVTYTTTPNVKVGSVCYNMSYQKSGYIEAINSDGTVKIRDNINNDSYDNIPYYAPGNISSKPIITDYDFVLNTTEETFRLPLKNHTADDSIEGLTLYFYVGETVQNANLIDAGRIGEQLATKTDMLQASGAGMPSTKYIDLTLGATGLTYTAPANGWFTCFKGGLTAAGYLYMRNNANYLIMETRSTINGTDVSAYVPVQKGQTILVNYDAVGTINIFRFIYAEGAKND